MDKFPPMKVVIDVFHYATCMLSGVPPRSLHHSRWLHFSSSNAGMGDRMWDVCEDLGLMQMVSQPTRGNYLFDLVLTDAPDLCKVMVLLEISDHRVVSLDIEVAVSFTNEIPRAVWQMHKVDWYQLHQDISRAKWQALFGDQDSDWSGARFCET